MQATNASPPKQLQTQGEDQALGAALTSADSLPSEARLPVAEPPSEEPGPVLRILVVDIGGTKVKILATGQTEPRKAPSGQRASTPTRLVTLVTELAEGWNYEIVSIGYPGLAGDHGPRSEPGNLGPGWVGFDFAAAFNRPVKLINDAAMQALGSYEGGRMLFLGLGTGLGSALISENSIVPLELGRLSARRKRTLGQLLGREGLKRIGLSAWRAGRPRDRCAAHGGFRGRLCGHRRRQRQATETAPSRGSRRK